MMSSSQPSNAPPELTPLTRLKSEDRPTSSKSFDAGINASSAWTGALEIRSSTAGSSEDKSRVEVPAGEEPTTDPPRQARALYDFEGKDDLRELTLRAGQELTIFKEDLAEGWSLAELHGNLGLVPRKYYIFTTDFATPPSLGSDASTTPTTSMNMNGLHTISEFITTPLQPQTTGPYFASLRQTLLGGKSFNRFSNFVTSGAEDWVLNGLPDQEDDDGGNDHHESSTPHIPKRTPEKDRHNGSETSSLHTDEAEEESHAHDRAANEKHFVEMPPAWKSKAPPFKVIVHSPSKRASTLTGGYTVYSVTSVFLADNAGMHSRFSSSSTIAASTSTQSISPAVLASHHQASSSYSQSPTAHSHLPEHDDLDEAATVHVTVFRRFSHFVFLHTALSRHLPGIALPPLPDKQYSGRFNDDFVEARRGDLERWLARVVRHPLARYSEVLVFFLSCDNEMEWRRSLPMYLAPPPAPGPSFYGHVYHPDYNLDAEEAEEAIDRFQRHLRGVGQGVQGLRGVFGKVREANVEMSAAQRALSYSLLSLITCTPTHNNPASPATPSLAYSMSQWEDDDESDENADQSRKGLMNDEGAWCWRDGCDDCLRRTKAFQRLAESLQSIANTYDDHARRTQLATHETLKDVAHPGGVYAGVIDTHKSTLSRYEEAAGDHDPDHDKAARCETVLNTTMAELDTYHTQKGEDFDKIAIEHLDGEIAFHEQVLARLRAARAAFDSSPAPTTTLPTPAPTPSTSKFSSMKSPTYSGPFSPSPMRQSSLLTQPLPVGPRQPSIYERDLAGATTRAIPPLPQPTAHVLDSTGTHNPIKPVGVAVRDGMSMILGGVGLRSGGMGGITGGVGSLGSVGSADSQSLGSVGSGSGHGGIGASIPGLEALRGSVMDFGRGRLWSIGSG
ncbi:hypothetical protein FRB94_013426 [Tulasnella sp. JGI-2019a]|nr:hypothetical protein FRB93_004857 [Tulasnella sp. JGI-2019a]KAG8990392.1 hypothetical protein FRB94_013426 [Tulasnella sp. JGI-2019a]